MACVIGSGSWGLAISSCIKCKNFSARSELISAFDEDIIFLALRAEDLYSFFEQYGKKMEGKIICSAVKGIFSYNQILTSKEVEKYDLNYAMLSGPNFADQVSAGVPTITTIASKNLNNSVVLSDLFRGTNIEVQISDDVISCEIFGIFKNVIALIAGYLDFLGKAENEKFFIITKLVAEVFDICTFFGGNPHNSFVLSCGVGDLFLTAGSSKSRNYRFGFSGFDSKFLNDTTVEGVRSLTCVSYLQKCGLKLDTMNWIQGLVHQIL